MKKRREEENTSYWLSYSDMMAALLLIFILIISFTILQSQVQYEQKENELIAEKQLVAEQQQQLEEQQEKLDKLIGIRTDLIEALKKEFEGSDLKVSVDEQTGAISLDSSILFDSGAYTVKPSGEEYLKKFIPKYIKVLTDKDYKEYISEILVEGHTDSQGDYIYNLQLSQQRALAVATYCLDSSKQILGENKIKDLKNVITANGKSYSSPILDKNGNEDSEKSRRVEFSFRLKDDEMISGISEILNR